MCCATAPTQLQQFLSFSAVNQGQCACNQPFPGIVQKVSTATQPALTAAMAGYNSKVDCNALLQATLLCRQEQFVTHTKYNAFPHSPASLAVRHSLYSAAAVPLHVKGSAAAEPSRVST